MNRWVKKYEASLAQRRYQFGKNRRLGQLHYVFKDCKLDAAPVVDTLVERLEVGIDEVREEESAVVLVDPVCLSVDLPVVVQGQALQVIHHDHDQVWAESTEGLAPGQILVQERVTMHEADIIRQFHDVWAPRWNKAHHVVPSQWEQICAFAERTLAPIAWPVDGWSVFRFRAAVGKKKATSGKGPDGVGQPDLAALPDAAVGACVRLLESVESGRPWPRQVAAGFVNSLAKNLHPQGIDDFRPVTVYSLFYRVWSSERAREALKAIQGILPASIQGGVPGRQAKSIWYQLAQTLEFAFMDSLPIHGLLMDIRKAFNAIPRYPLWFALECLGFPRHVLAAWCAFVSGQTRRFRVRQATGEAVGSNCGLPEGCALSVFGMVIVDYLLDCWLVAHTKGVSLRAFVDDWGLLFGSAGDFPAVWSCVQAFVSALDLSLDMTKTRVWSTDGAGRAELKTCDVGLAYYARNLGAHQNFTRHCWNSTLQNRLKGMPKIWTLMRASLSPYAHKLKALSILGWPRALHGVSVVHLGHSHYKALRSGAMKGLKVDRKGSNPVLHLASGDINADPEAWAICQTLRDARELGGFDRVEACLGLFASSPVDLPKNGPAAILVSRVARLGWTFGANGLVQDRLGTFSLFAVSWDELCLRLKLAWAHVMDVEVSHRASFAGLGQVDVVTTQQAVAQFGAADQAFLRCHLDGTLFVQNGRAKFQPGVTDRCPGCGEKDGFAHRAWTCPFFESCRSHLTSSQRQLASTMPDCFSIHGWAVVLAEWEVYMDFLQKGCWVF